MELSERHLRFSAFLRGDAELGTKSAHAGYLLLAAVKGNASLIRVVV